MRIESTGAQPTLPPAAATRPAARTADATATATTTAEPGTAREFALTGKLAALLSAVRQAPDVRPNVVTEAISRLAAGDFSTPEAAAAAAAAVAQTLPNDGPAS